MNQQLREQHPGLVSSLVSVVRDVRGLTFSGSAVQRARPRGKSPEPTGFKVGCPPVADAGAETPREHIYIYIYMNDMI